MHGPRVDSTVALAASGELNETTGYDVEGPPAVATMLVVTDLDTPTGAQLAKAALQLADRSTKVRLSFLHNPPSFDDMPHPYALSNTLWALHKDKKLDEILPGELISWIDLSLSSEGPEDGAGLSWQPENPLKELIKAKGVDKEKAFDALLWWEELQWLVSKLGFGPGENGIILNGRVCPLFHFHFHFPLPEPSRLVTDPVNLTLAGRRSVPRRRFRPSRLAHAPRARARQAHRASRRRLQLDRVRPHARQPVRPCSSLLAEAQS